MDGPKPPKQPNMPGEPQPDRPSPRIPEHDDVGQAQPVDQGLDHLRLRVEDRLAQLVAVTSSGPSPTRCRRDVVRGFGAAVVVIAEAAPSAAADITPAANATCKAILVMTFPPDRMNRHGSHAMHHDDWRAGI